MNIGFSKIKITPSLGTVLGGQPHVKRAESVESDLFVRAMCFFRRDYHDVANES